MCLLEVVLWMSLDMSVCGGYFDVFRCVYVRWLHWCV